jgi:hypothetical protein
LNSIISKTNVVFLSLLFIVNSILAQSLREPNAVEKKVLDKAVPVIVGVLDKCNDDNWNLEQNWYDDNPLVPVNYNEKGPIDINQNFERDYEVNLDSKRFNDIIKPVYDKSQALTDKVVALVKESEKNPQKNNKSESDLLKDSLKVVNNKLDELSELHVFAYINDHSVKGRPVKDLSVPGASMVTKFNGGHLSLDYFKSYYIAFGNWKSAKWSSDLKAYFYKFKDTPKPTVQNIVIIMTGAQDRMKELMHKINWSVLNKALTD